MVSSILHAFGSVLTPELLLVMLLGSVVGIVFGSIPGLTYSMGIILFLPMTFRLSPLAAISLLLGVYIGGMTGGSVAAILLGIPGTPSAAATVFDGYPLAKKGLAGKALGTALVASIFGGLLSVITLMIVAPLIANFALNFGPAEIFALVLFGLSTICGVSAGNILKGLVSGCIGLLVMTIGLDPVMGMPRYTFGFSRLIAGVDLLPFMIGMFAIPQIVQSFSTTEVKIENITSKKIKTVYPSLKELRRMFWLTFRCALIGIGIGSIPGTGGPVAAFLGYDQARRTKKSEGPALEGIAGPEAANNGVTGGALIPMFTLGIPGDAATAVLLGALMIHGLKPGPLLFSQHADFVYGVYAALIVIHVIVLFVQGFGIRFFVKILNFRKCYLFSTILVLCTIGAYAVNNNVFDIYVMFFAGLLAFFMTKYDYPVAPAVLALVLGPVMEDSFRRALILSQGSFNIFVTSPISLVFYSLTVLILIGQIRRSAKNAGSGTGK
ncbi:MAG: tripartite tricarboxylate transporter permease [Spirochaetales bacterium]|jgi:putative tricarboxylic transport membrane protein|nr:tripartite tricarboxylate transporter permease [Spirochaetales bacterium]